MAQIRQLQRSQPQFRKRKLCPKKFIDYQMHNLSDLHGGSYKRAIFYFANGDDANVNDYFLTPNHNIPGEIKDLYFKFCGHKLKKSTEFDDFVEKCVPAKFQSRFSKSEKGVDIEMCCDALRLASKAQVDRLFLLTNDGDFIPFCRTIKEFGTNVSIIHLSAASPPNSDLLREVDSYDVVGDEFMEHIFTPQVPENDTQSLSGAEHGEQNGVVDQLPHSEKPDAAPSDLASISDTDPTQQEE